jgi:hypothetical protein
MQLIEVTSPKLAKDFIMVNVEINKGVPAYIRPLDKDIHDIFDPKKNKAYRFGETNRWILKDDNGKLIGRIAAYVNKKYRTKGDEFPVGGIGFFDSIDNQQAADMLFDVAKHWLMQKGNGSDGWPHQFWRKGSLVGADRGRVSFNALWHEL